MIKTRGIVFRTMKYRESSMILDIYTEELGLRSYLVNGVRSSKSKKSANILQPMSQLDLIVYDTKGAGQLNRISEFKLDHFYRKIPFDVVRGMIGQCMIEILRKTVKDDEANPVMYRFIQSWFRFLDSTTESVKNILIVFMVELASMVGFAFDLEKGKDDYFDLQEGVFTAEIPLHIYYLDPQLSEYLYQAVHLAKSECHELNMPNKHRSILIDQLVIFYRLHVPSFGELSTLDILRGILS